MFSFCDVILEDESIVRGVCIHSHEENGVFLFNRNPICHEKLHTEGYVTSVPVDLIEHVRYFAVVDMNERVSALSMMTTDQLELIIEEMHSFVARRDLHGMERLLGLITVTEMMILLTEIELERYIYRDEQVVRFVDEISHPINFYDSQTITWLLTSYMQAAEQLRSVLPENEKKLTEYRRIFYEMSYEEIGALSTQETEERNC